MCVSRKVPRGAEGVFGGYFEGNQCVCGWMVMMMMVVVVVVVVEWL